VAGLDAKAHLQQLVGRTINTVSGRPNHILEIRGAEVIVGTTKSPNGQPVPVKWVQDAVDQLEQAGEITIDVETLGYRSAFIGAVLLTVPGARLAHTAPPVITLGP
jgi:hypothetical protein